MSYIEDVLEEVTKNGYCKCPECEHGIVYPLRRDMPADRQHYFDCDSCNFGIRTLARITVE